MTDVRQLVAGVAGLGDANSAPRLVGIGWATVDLERTAASLGTLDVRPADDDVLLGARALRIDLGPVSVVLLEPTTEGRLAAALARRGEGIVALYLRSDDPVPGIREGALRPTALGVPGRLSPQGKPWGPFLIELSPSVPDGASSPGRGGHRP